MKRWTRCNSLEVVCYTAWMVQESEHVELIYSGGNLYEGPLWDADSGLWWLDIHDARVFHMPIEAPRSRVMTYSLPVTALARAGNGCVWAFSAQRAWKLGVTGEEPRGIEERGEYPIEPALIARDAGSGSVGRSNDGGASPWNTMLLGTMVEPPRDGAGTLHELHPPNGPPGDGVMQSQLIRPDVTISNGIAFSRANKVPGFYYIDTPRRQVEFAEADSGGYHFRVVIDLKDETGFPDGMTMDAQGLLYVAMWSGSTLLIADPITARVTRRVTIPSLNVTSCAFGGPDMRDLFVTSAEQDGDNEQAACLYRIRRLASGMSEPVLWSTRISS